MELNKIIHGDCLEVMKTLPENSVDAVVTDPPYGLSFMGKKWDYDVPSQEIWEECLRVLKPGGYLLAFAGTRTQHRMAVRIEDAGFEIRDMIAWVYGSGFPKSLNIGKAVDKLQGNEREEVEHRFPDGSKPRKTQHIDFYTEDEGNIGKATYTKGNSEWEGWGTALKPALEPITVARKPLSEKTVAENVLKWGTGGINIDECRVGTGAKKWSEPKGGIWNDSVDNGAVLEDNPQGRFPANLIHDGSDEVVSLFPNTKSGTIKPYKHANRNNTCYGEQPEFVTFNKEGDSGSASRFFQKCEFTEEETLCENCNGRGDINIGANVCWKCEGTGKRFAYIPKASKSERNKGCEELEEKETRGGGGRVEQGYDRTDPEQERLRKAATAYGAVKAVKHNSHPTVKPIALMEYLVKLVSREGAVVLDPFAGSGSTLIACKNLKRNYIGCELDPEYIKIAEARIKSIYNPLF